MRRVEEKVNRLLFADWGKVGLLSYVTCLTRRTGQEGPRGPVLCRTQALGALSVLDRVNELSKCAGGIHADGDEGQSVVSKGIKSRLVQLGRRRVERLITSREKGVLVLIHEQACGTASSRKESVYLYNELRVTKQYEEALLSARRRGINQLKDLDRRIQQGTTLPSPTIFRRCWLATPWTSFGRCRTSYCPCLRWGFRSHTFPGHLQEHAVGGREIRRRGETFSLRRRRWNHYPSTKKGVYNSANCHLEKMAIEPK